MIPLLNTPYAPRPIELDPVEGVAWGNQATQRLVSGPTYQDIQFVTNITDPKDIERIRITNNGKEFVSLSGQDIVDLNKHRKNYVEAGRYVIPFADLGMRTKAGVRTGELVTLKGEIFFVYIQLKPDASGTKPAPSIRARAMVTPSQDIRYYMPRIYTLNWHAPAAGRTPFDWAERSPFFSIKRLHFNNDDITRVRVVRDDREEMNVSASDNAFDMDYHGLEQVNTRFSLDFVATGFGAEGRLETTAAKSLQFEVEKTSFGSVNLLIEAIEQVAPLPHQVQTVQ